MFTAFIENMFCVADEIANINLFAFVLFPQISKRSLQIVKSTLVAFKPFVVQKLGQWDYKMILLQFVQ